MIQGANIQIRLAVKLTALLCALTLTCGRVCAQQPAQSGGGGRGEPAFCATPLFLTGSLNQPTSGALTQPPSGALKQPPSGALIPQPKLHARGEFDFCNYLLGNSLMSDARTFAQQPLDEQIWTPDALDTLRYVRGWVHYNLRDFARATDSFAEVGPSSPFYPKSVFYGAVCRVEEGDFEQAATLLDGFAAAPVAADYGELLAFERAGLALLEGDIEEYENQKSHFTYSDFALSEQQKIFDQIAARRPRELSPWVAAAASAVVPGLGKIYAGQLSEGVASFLLVGAFAGLTAESWKRAETPANWRTILYGSIGSLLYVGNILGSAASVKIYYQNFENSTKGAVVYGLHIPLRSVFR